MYFWPHLRNPVQAHISVKTIGSSTYLIESNQSTCFIGGLYCRKCTAYHVISDHHLMAYKQLLYL